MGGPVEGPDKGWREIPGTGRPSGAGALSGLRVAGFVVVRGPCGAQHSMTPPQARALAEWLRAEADAEDARAAERAAERRERALRDELTTRWGG